MDRNLLPTRRFRSNPLSALAIAAGLALALAAGSARAVDHTWIGSGGGSWTDPTKWSPSSIPTTDNVFIYHTNQDPTQIIYDASTYSSTTHDIWMDNDGSAGFFRFSNWLNHTGGSLMARRLILGARSNGIGGSAQSGGSTTLTSALELGTSTTGWGLYQLSSGSLNITGAGGGELGLFVGYGGEGTFDQTGGSVTTASNVPLVIARNPGSTSTYTINGATATAQFDGSAYVGGNASAAGGTGFLNVVNGAMTVANTLKVWNNGHVNVSGGTLTIGALVGNVTLSGGTLATTTTGSPFSLPTVAVACGGGTLSTAAGTTFYATLGEGAGTLTKTGTGTLSLGGDSFRTGDTRINGGAILVNRTSSLGSGNTQAISFDGGALHVFEHDSTARPITLGPGGGTIAPRFIQMTSFPFLKYSIDFSVTSPIVGGGGLTKGGGGRLFLTGANTYTGGTVVTSEFNAPPESALYIGSGGTTGSIVGNVINNHRLIFSRSDNTAFAGVISGPGTVSQFGGGTGTLVFTGNNTYSGVTSVSSGSLQIGAGGTSGAIASDVVLGFGGRIAFNRSDDSTYAGVISGSGELAKSGSGTLSLTANQTYNGLTTVNAGALAVNGSILGGAEVNSGGTLKGTGTIGGAVTVNAGGVFAPGTSPGTITVAGLNMRNGSTLAYELGTTRDHIVVTNNGNVSLGGILNISLLDGFIPSSPVMLFEGSIGSITGAFSAVNAPVFNGQTLSLLYSANQVTLQVVALPPGDYNQNGIVDAADYVVWRKGLGTTYTPGHYNTWRAHFGETAGLGSGGVANAAVPEPATAVLLIFAAAGWCVRRGRRA